jgi:hypothetical protein
MNWLAPPPITVLNRHISRNRIPVQTQEQSPVQTQEQSPDQTSKLQVQNQEQSPDQTQEQSPDQSTQANQAKNKKCPRHKHHPELYDPVMLDPFKIADEQHNLYCIQKTRRQAYYVKGDNFIQEVLNALQSSKYQVVKNIKQKYQDGTITDMKNEFKDFTYHNQTHKIYVRVAVVRGHREQDINGNISVDILGICKKGSTIPMILEDPICSALIDRILCLARETHLPCVSHNCLWICEKQNLQQDVPVICPMCKTEQCFTCHAVWEHHQGMTCESFSATERLHKLVGDHKDALADGIVQPCPKCKVIVYRQDGCNHMTCTEACREHWCWACGLDGLQHRYQDPYHHFRRGQCPTADVFSNPTEAQRMIAARNKLAFPWLFTTKENGDNKTTLTESDEKLDA